MNLLEGMLSNCGEGNISWFENRQEKIVQLISEIKPINLMEIGFNMGHSAMLICQTIMNLKSNDTDYKSKKINFFIFDICEHSCVKTNFSILEKEFGSHIKFVLIEGNTLFTLNDFFEKNSIIFDFIEIDGCHTYDCVRSDTFNTLKNLSNNGIIYIDDYKSDIFPISDVDLGVDSIDWSDFETNYIDGVFWAKRQYNFNKNNSISTGDKMLYNDNKFRDFILMVSLMLSEEDNEILNHNVNYLKNLTSLMRQKFIM